MIRVNLLPSKKEAKSRKAAAPKAAGEGAPGVVALVVVLCLAVAGGYAYYVGGKQYASIKAHGEAKRAHDAKEKVVLDMEDKVKGLAKIAEALKNEFKSIGDLSPSDRLIWAEKMHQLAELVPPNVYLSTVEMTQTITEVETEASREAFARWSSSTDKNKPSTPPAKQTRRKIDQKLALRGVTNAERPEARQQLMLDLYRALSTHASLRPTGAVAANSETTTQPTPVAFISGFRPEIRINPYDMAVQEGVEVLRFSFDLDTVSREG